MSNNDLNLVARGLEIMRDRGDHRVVLAGTGPCINRGDAFINNLDLVDEAEHWARRDEPASALPLFERSSVLPLFAWSAERNLGFSGMLL
jgi:hypothetical protein